jgi:hypothetical protein
MAGVGCDGGDECGGDDWGDKGAGDAWRLSKPLAMVVVTALETSMRKGVADAMAEAESVVKGNHLMDSVAKMLATSAVAVLSTEISAEASRGSVRDASVGGLANGTV